MCDATFWVQLTLTERSYTEIHMLAFSYATQWVPVFIKMVRLSEVTCMMFYKVFKKCLEMLHKMMLTE